MVARKYSHNKLDFINKYCQKNSSDNIERTINYSNNQKIRKVILSNSSAIAIGLLLLIFRFPIYSEISKQINQSANRSTEKLLQEAVLERELEKQNHAQ